MSKKQIKILAIKSYTRGNLDPKKVEGISKLLTRADLKNYLRALKTIEANKKVYVFVPSLEKFKKEDLKKAFGKMFPQKKIVYDEDSSLMVGIKVINNDQIFEFNLKNTLDDLSSYLENQYDQ